MSHPSPLRTRIKICGITRPDDALAAAREGADALGLVFYPPSPRAITVERARAVAAAVPPFVTLVGLFVDAAPAAIEAILREVPLALLQFHGEEEPELCRSFALPYIKAIPMREGVDLTREAGRFHDARGLLLDTYRPGIPGGTGAVFEWERVPKRLDKPIILAGGLNPESVFEAVRTVRPYAVDVSSGVEAGKGVKDHGKVAAFIREVQRADAAD